MSRPTPIPRTPYKINDRKVILKCTFMKNFANIYNMIKSMEKKLGPKFTDISYTIHNQDCISIECHRLTEHRIKSLLDICASHTTKCTRVDETIFHS